MRVVLVDDSPDVLYLATAMLAPIEVAGTFRSAEDAVTYTGWSSVDVAVIDWVMPGGGDAVAGFLRNNYPDVLRVVFSVLEGMPDGADCALVDAWVEKTDIADLPLRLKALAAAR